MIVVFNDPVQLLSVAAFVLVLALSIRRFRRELNGDNYYTKYPAAKPLDDAAMRGKLVPGSTVEIFRRLGGAGDFKTGIEAIRLEMGVN